MPHVLGSFNHTIFVLDLYILRLFSNLAITFLFQIRYTDTLFTEQEVLNM